MQLSALNALLATTGLTLAMPSSILSRTTTCPSDAESNCYRFMIDATLADQAITDACQQIPVCVPGTVYPPGRGRIPEYTAVLYVGLQCGGITDWNLDTCKALFWDNVDARCGRVDGFFHCKLDAGIGVWEWRIDANGLQRVGALCRPVIERLCLSTWGVRWFWRGWNWGFDVADSGKVPCAMPWSSARNVCIIYTGR
ncbi:hypothetical protein CC80DRAFT_496279 [Byssothecium circinans]|uniref:Uncharacterized protein n=1 Tax=Byssothecium circinans TaxID=147558 RepID=A0A6A5TQP3_9PLEO|nr:hypothetical protein CC80DRAFT_496279 [Byssothecium circinans]